MTHYEQITRDFTVRITDAHDAADTQTCTLAEYLEANAEMDCSDVVALTIGQSVKVGGGAAPSLTVERVS